MKKKNIILSILLLFCLICACGKKDVSNASFQNNTNIAETIEKKNDKDIVIFATNDVYGAYDDKLGYAKLKHFIDNFDRKDNYVALVDIGNFSTGSELANNSKGKASCEIMNAVSYDLIVPGSHEFDYGIDTFLENMKEFGDKVVSCNILDLISNELLFPPYKIIKFGNYNVAFIGVTSPETLYLADDNIFYKDNEQLISFFEDEDGTRLYNQIQDTVNDAKNNGADKIILLSHLGNNGVSSKWQSTSIIEATTGIDAVIDGHSMELIDSGLMANRRGAFVPIVQGGSRLQYVSVMNIQKDGYIFPAIISKNSVNTDDENIINLINNLKEKYR